MEQKLQEQNTNGNLLGTITSTEGNGSGSVLLDYLKCASVGVKIENLKRSFGDNYVLRGVALDINDEEAVAIDSHIRVDACWLKGAGGEVACDGGHARAQAHLRGVGAAEGAGGRGAGTQAL